MRPYSVITSLRYTWGMYQPPSPPKPPSHPTEVELLAQDERERVTQWRIERLLEAGYESDYALLIGVDQSIDLHRAIQLLEDGCPVDTALQILF